MPENAVNKKTLFFLCLLLIILSCQLSVNNNIKQVDTILPEGFSGVNFGISSYELKEIRPQSFINSSLLNGMEECNTENSKLPFEQITYFFQSESNTELRNLSKIIFSSYLFNKSHIKLIENMLINILGKNFNILSAKINSDNNVSIDFNKMYFWKINKVGILFYYPTDETFINAKQKNIPDFMIEKSINLIYWNLDDMALKKFLNEHFPSQFIKIDDSNLIISD